MTLNLIHINSGLIKGVPCGNPSYTVFKGIPYAAPPVGELRFKAPLEPIPWEGVRICDTFPPISIQEFLPEGEFYQKEFFPTEMPMSEDCLYLNVWTPSKTSNEKLPVMFWIHGGAFIRGYGHEMEFDGEAFCKRDVILVTVDCRLGALGFFSHPELSKRDPNHVSGNYAILDLVRALKWVQDNIEAFGGDPSNVTVFGQSAGGLLTRALAVSPLAKGLFHKAIIQSAAGINSISPKQTLAESEKYGKQITDKLNISADNLLNMPAEELTDLLNSAIDLNELRMCPIVDGYVLDDFPGNSIALGKHADIPYMTGSVERDGKLFSGYPNIKSKNEFEEYLNKQYGDDAKEYISLFNIKSDSEAVETLDLFLESTAKLAPYSWANAHVRQGMNPVYVYYFDRDIPGEDHPGAFHSSELWYIFSTLNRCWRPMKGIDYDLSNLMTDYWTNFAKYGDPNADTLPSWPAFTEENHAIMEINEKHTKAINTKNNILDKMEELLYKEIRSKND